MLRNGVNIDTPGNHPGSDALAAEALRQAAEAAKRDLSPLGIPLGMNKQNPVLWPGFDTYAAMRGER